MQCLECGSVKIRPSRLRLSDMPRLMLLRMPVRCHTCLSRTYTPLVLALRMRQARRAHS